MDKIVGIELSHRFAPIAVREQLAFNDTQIEEALLELKPHFKEVYILSTCNRVSVYAFGPSYEPLVEFFNRFGNFGPYLSLLPDSPIAVKNLLSTAAGLESQAIGEHQIVGQIRHSLDLARKQKAIGPVLDQLVRKAIYTGKKVRLETNIGKHSASLATVAYELIHKHRIKLEEATILLIGTGNMANLMATILDRSSFKKLYVASHDAERAGEMAANWKGEAVSMSQLHEIVFDADLIIGGTQGEVNILLEKELPESKCTRARFAIGVHSPKLFIDFGVPRNFNPDLKQFKNIHLFDLDDIKQLTFESLLKRYDEIPLARNIVNREVEDYEEWYDHRKVAPVLEAFSNNLDEIKESELKWLLPKLGDIDDKQKKLLERYTHRLIRKISKEPIQGIKKLASNLPEQDNPINTVKHIFDLKQVDIFIPERKILVGTRGSKLAIAQSNQVIEALKKIEPKYQFIINVIKTSGDEGNIDVMGAFTTAIQRSLLDGNVDLAIHSFKDLPVETVNGLVIAANPVREDARDVLLSHQHCGLMDLKPNSVVGTSSLRRKMQLLHHRPDLQIKHIQGNIDTRIKKMNDGEYDAIILAAAGMKRLGMEEIIDQYMDFDHMLPAAGQGALGLECRDEKSYLKDLAQALNHETTAHAVNTERAVLVELGGGCKAPIATYTTIDNGIMTLDGLFGAEEGQHLVHHRMAGPVQEREQMAADMALTLKNKLQEKQTQVLSETSSK